MTTISKDTISFIDDLRENNDRPWFNSHKDRYQAALTNMKEFLASLTDEMNKVDSIEKNKLFRIYKDVRFSKDKTPYNPYWHMSMGRTKPHLRGGYYLKISSEGGYMACGFWNPESSDLALIRANIDANDKAFRKAINDKKLVSTFGQMTGDAVKTAPKGYKKDHPSIDLLRHKQFVFRKEFSRKQILDKDFIKIVVDSYKAVRPFFNHMSDILGHNLNGEPLY